MARHRHPRPPRIPRRRPSLGTAIAVLVTLLLIGGAVAVIAGHRPSSTSCYGAHAGRWC